jgi:hypothetical protein
LLFLCLFRFRLLALFSVLVLFLDPGGREEGRDLQQGIAELHAFIRTGQREVVGRLVGPLLNQAALDAQTGGLRTELGRAKSCKRGQPEHAHTGKEPLQLFQQGVIPQAARRRHLRVIAARREDRQPPVRGEQATHVDRSERRAWTEPDRPLRYQDEVEWSRVLQHPPLEGRELQAGHWLVLVGTRHGGLVGVHSQHRPRPQHTQPHRPQTLGTSQLENSPIGEQRRQIAVHDQAPVPGIKRAQQRHVATAIYPTPWSSISPSS